MLGAHDIGDRVLNALPAGGCVAFPAGRGDAIRTHAERGGQGQNRGSAGLPDPSGAKVVQGTDADACPLRELAVVAADPTGEEQGVERFGAGHVRECAELPRKRQGNPVDIRCSSADTRTQQERRPAPNCQEERGPADSEPVRHEAMTTTLAAPVSPAQRLTPAQQRAALLGMRAALVETETYRCPKHGVDDARGFCDRRCDPSLIEWAGQTIEDAIENQDDDLRDVAIRMRRATRSKLIDEARQDRDDDLRARGEE
jgi:hypothetical protein